jgi:C_GCAxxG_C_C family probable redox protein
MEERVNAAVELFDQGFVCSQAVFAAFSDLYGLGESTALKIANGFGGRIARNQEVCGAVSGAVMAIGLKDGKISPEDSKAHENTYQAVNSFMQKFKEKNKTIICGELLGCDMAAARERGLFHTACRKYVRDAAEIVSEILEL